MSDWINWPPTWATLLLLPALLVGFTVHELAHAVVAYLLGDTSQLERNRLTFNPLRHVSWVGMFVFLLFGFGWAKPVWVDHTRLRLRNRAFGTFLVSISGAAANLLLGVLVLGGMTVTMFVAWAYTGAPWTEAMQFLVTSAPGIDVQGIAVALSYYMFIVNLLLALFNLIPIPPLDGFQAAVSLVMAVRIALRQRDGGEAATPQRTAAGWPQAGRVEESAPGEAPPPSPAEIHFEIGLDYHRAGQLDEAIARYRQATAHDADHALAYYNLGLAYWAKGRTPLAISAFRAVLRTRGDPAVRMQADLQLRKLVRVEEDPDASPGPVPPPLDAPEALPAPAPEPVDPAIARGLWMRLAVGAAAALVLAVVAWAYITVVTVMAMG
jgi:Zn-dependent protease